jgi:exonuclease SbcD
VLAVSHPTAACLPPIERMSEEGGSPVVAATRALYTELAEGNADRTRGLPLLVTGHLHVTGGLESEGAERRILVGGQHAVPPDVFPEAAAYVALGHLHRPQWIGGNRVRYSGSLLPLSAAEIGYRHGVTLLTIDGGGAIVAEPIELPRPVPFFRVPERGECRLAELADHLAALAVPPDVPLDMRPFVVLRLSRTELPAGWRAQVEEIAERFPVRVVDYRAGEAEARPREVTAEPHVRLAELQPEEMFVRAFERAHDGARPTAAHLEVFHVAAAAAAAEGG